LGTSIYSLPHFTSVPPVGSLRYSSNHAGQDWQSVMREDM
jgi:hypothetical protein